MSMTGYAKNEIEIACKKNVVIKLPMEEIVDVRATKRRKAVMYKSLVTGLRGCRTVRGSGGIER